MASGETTANDTIQRVFRSDVVQPLLKSPIPISEVPTGKYFRNREEIDDLSDAMDLLPTDYLKYGLVGSRTDNKFTYTPLKLFARLIDLLKLPRETASFIHPNFEPNYELVKKLSEYLDKEVMGTTNIDDIDFNKLPEELQKLVELPYYYQNRLGKPRPKYQKPQGDKFYRPAVLVPDIDLAYLTTTPFYPRNYPDEVVGKRSGVVIHLINISPVSFDKGVSYEDAVVSATIMARQFVPLRLP